MKETKTAEEIAEKYVRGNHDALTDNQEIKDMAADIEEYASIKAEQARREEREKFLLDEGVRFTKEDMVEFAEWFSRNWDLDFKADQGLEVWLKERESKRLREVLEYILEQWLEERRKNNVKYNE